MVIDKIIEAEYDLYNLQKEVVRITKELEANPELFEKRDIKATMNAMNTFKKLGRGLVDG